MEIHDGFIISIFNYCDRWCEACTLTSRCRLFADVARAESASDPTIASVTHSSRAIRADTLARPRWLEEILSEMNCLGGRSLRGEEIAAERPAMPREHERIYERAKEYCAWVYDRLAPQTRTFGDDAKDPAAVILWFATLNASKIRRALTGLAEFDGVRDIAPDHEGAAKVALLGIDRSCDAWQQLVDTKRISATRARPCVEELCWLRASLEAAVPGARAFVRPGFDEPDAVAALLE